MHFDILNMYFQNSLVFHIFSGVASQSVMLQAQDDRAGYQTKPLSANMGYQGFISIRQGGFEFIGC